MYHHDSFHLRKNGRGNEWEGGRRIRKTTKKCLELNKISNLTSPKNSLENAIKVGFFLLSSKTI